MKKMPLKRINKLSSILIAALLAACTTNPSSQTETPAVKGRYVAVISDADMRAMTYIDRQLGEKRGSDRLTIVSLPPNESKQPTAQIEVSNSVVNPVFSIDATSDGNTIFVAESRQQREANDRTLEDLEFGTLVRAIDLSNPASPNIIDTVEVGQNPKTASINSEGNLLVISTSESDRTLVFVPFIEGKFGTPNSFPLKGFKPSRDYWDRGGIIAHSVEWHPTENIIAVTLRDRNQVAFYKVDRDNNGNVTDINLWGNRIAVTKFPMSGRFSRDGRFFISNDMQWGPDVNLFYENTPPSILNVIRLADLDAPADEARHIIVGGAAVPRNAESIAVSRDGSLIATLNIGQYWLDPKDPNYSRASISLLSFDRNIGKLTHLGDWEFDGILPQGLAFDANDEYLAVGVFEYPDRPSGGLEFWRIVRQPEISLVRSNYIIETGPGAHSLVLIP